MPFQIAWLPLFNGARAQNKTVTAGAFLDNDKAVLTCFCEQHWGSGCHSVGKFVKRTWTLLSCFGMLVAKELGEKHAGKPNIQYVLDTFNTIWSFLGTYDDH